MIEDIAEAPPAVPPAGAGQLARLLREASLETSIQDLSRVQGQCALLPRGTMTFVPWLPSAPYHHLVSVATRLAEAGLTPVPHIAARRLADARSAQDLLSRLRGEAGVERVLLIGGDVPRPAGPFEDAAAFLASGLLDRYGFRQVGLAGYPEGHPAIAAQTLWTSLSEKLSLAKKRGLSPFVVTQFCFEAQPILDWVAEARRAGIDAPIRVGLAAPASVRTLIAYGARCGVGSSLRAIKSQGLSLTRLVSSTGPEGILEKLGQVSLDEGIALHFFAFGGVERAARWLTELASKGR